MIESLTGTVETISFELSSSVRFYRNVNSECFPPHWHLAGEIIAPISNIYTVTVTGDTMVLRPGDILIIAPGELHSIEAPSTGVRYIVNYDTEQFEQFQDLSFLFTVLRPYYLLRKQASSEVVAPLFSLLEQIETEYLGDSAYRDEMIYSYQLQFLALLGRLGIVLDKFQDSTLSKQQAYNEQFIQVCNYINKHCTENLTLEQVAEHAGFSKYHFSRLFKKFTGTTFHEYLTSSRILWAKKLLVDSSTSITEIAMRSGFNSLATFNRIFKNELGCTPSEYRKLNALNANIYQS
ncbi:MAG: AraC family transcriptional regulator [Clostridiales bacterium]|nr:AraC family transcriptional regulator [Clostridiales bacterium]